MVKLLKPAHGAKLALPMLLWGCQVVSGLSELEVTSAGGGAPGTGGAPAAGGGDGTGGADATGGAPSAAGGGTGSSCTVGWETDSCRGTCGDISDGVAVGCANFLKCYAKNVCNPQSCSAESDSLCGRNRIENGADASLAMAIGVFNCMCDGGRPAPCESVYEAEDVQHSSGESSDGLSWTLSANASISFDHNFMDGQADLVVRARGETVTQPFPHIQLFVADAHVGDLTVASSEFSDFRVTIQAVAGTKTIRIEFDNADASGERKVTIDSLRVPIACPN